MRNALSMLVVAGVLVGGLLMWRSGRPAAVGGRSPAVGSAPTNVVLISIDTLRADHLGCYGHPAQVTPRIDQLAAEGVLFTQCTAAAPLTLPSHATMLTGTQPYVHGARDNGHFHLHADNVTLPEVLGRAGFATLAEVAAYVLNHEYGLGQGFDVYHDVTVGEGVIGIAERRGDEVCESAIRLLDAHRDERFFLFVHMYDPHFPYQAPEEVAAAIDDPYLAEIAFVDRQVGRLLDALAARSLDRDTLVILVADHGESLGAHGERTHGVHVYDATMAVPMIWRYPGRLPAGRRVPGQVRLADLAPTVLDLLALPPLADAEGVSLVPLLEGRVDDDGRLAYSESMMPYHNWGYAAPRAVRQAGWKYVHAGSPQLFDLRSDPEELRNLAAAEPDRAAALRAALEDLITEAPQVVTRTAATREASAAEIARLQSLGYLGGDEHAGGARSELELLRLAETLPDTHEHSAEVDRMQSALRQIILQNYPQAVRDLEEVIELRGANAAMPWVYGNLGLALARLGRHEESLPHYRRAVELQADNGTTLTNYALSLIELGRNEEAAAILRQALDVEPVLAATHEAYGLALYRLGRIDEALAQFRAAQRISPGAAHIAARLARVLLEADRPEEAAAALDRVLAAQPENVALLELQAEALLRAGRGSEAMDALQRVVGLAPERDRAWHILGFARLRAEDWAAAAEALRGAAAAAPENRRYANDLAWLLATCPDADVRDGAAALRIVTRAAEQAAHPDANLLDTRAAALAELGRFDEAIDVMKAALELADAARIADLEERRKMYESGVPYRLGR